MSEDSTKEESVKVHWTFDEAAAVAEHLAKDVGISRCLFIVGGWTEGGYDCRHPDNLPANPECGGNEALADAIRRIQALGYVACLHDNYQDMYHDAKSWDPACIEKKPDGSLIQGGRWLGGRAYMVCALSSSNWRCGRKTSPPSSSCSLRGAISSTRRMRSAHESARIPIIR